MKKGLEEKIFVVISHDKDELEEFVRRIFSQSGINLRPRLSGLSAKNLKLRCF